MKKYALAACAALGLGTAADAASFSVAGSFSGGQLGDVTFDLVVTGDFTGNITETAVDSAILTSSVLNPFNASDVGGVGFTFSTGSSNLTFGGLTSGTGSIFGATTDFGLSINDIFGDQIVVTAADSLSSVAGSSPISLDELFVTEINATVPLPAPAALLLTGLAFLAFQSRRSSKA